MKNRGAVSVRTPRHLYSLSQFPEYYHSQAHNLTFRQELDLDYGTYTGYSLFGAAGGASAPHSRMMPRLRPASPPIYRVEPSGTLYLNQGNFTYRGISYNANYTRYKASPVEYETLAGSTSAVAGMSKVEGSGKGGQAADPVAVGLLGIHRQQLHIVGLCFVQLQLFPIVGAHLPQLHEAGPLSVVGPGAGGADARLHLPLLPHLHPGQRQGWPLPK